MAFGGVPLDQWNGSIETKRLRETIERLDATNAKQTRTMVRLTWATVALAVVTLAVGVLQLVSAWR